MQIQFTKMHGLGNDFIIIDGINQSLPSLGSEDITFLCNRHRGIGCDQLLLITKTTNNQADFACTIFNADGSLAEHCGNGMRCIARFLKSHQFITKNDIVLEVAGRLIYATINDDNSVSVAMGKPIFSVANVPFKTELENDKFTYEVCGHSLAVLSMGNPHAVLPVDNVDNVDVAGIGKQIQQSEQFPNSVNVGFVQVLNNHEIKLRVYERGAGETFACGSGACAAVVYLTQLNVLAKPVTVHLLGGKLNIDYVTGGSVLMSGETEFVFSGQVTL